MKKYKIRTKFVFEGEFIVEAENRAEAKQAVEKHCGLVLGGNIHTTYDDDSIIWYFDTHPNKIISTPTILK